MRTLTACWAVLLWTACSSDAASPGAVDDGGGVGSDAPPDDAAGRSDGGGPGLEDAPNGGDSARAADTGTADALHDGPSALGCQAGAYKLCEDFESTAPGAIPAGWTKQGEVSVAADMVHAGAHALEVGIATNGPRRISRPLAALGANASDHWGRVFYKVASPAPTYDGYLHSTMVAMQGKSPVDGIDIEARVVDTVQGPQATHQFLYNVQPSGRAEFGTGSSYDYKYDDKWHCAEWHVAYATQSYSFFLDGVEVTKIHIDAGAGNFANVEIPSAYQSISVGWYNYQVLPSGGFQAWLDDFAMNDARVGCLTP